MLQNLIFSCACVEKLGHRCYIEDPTMEQLENHTRDAVAFAKEHSSTTTEAGHVIIGAWNENDEGHWIVPSLEKGTEKLEAVQRGIHAGNR